MAAAPAAVAAVAGERWLRKRCCKAMFSTHRAPAQDACVRLVDQGTQPGGLQMSNAGYIPVAAWAGAGASVGSAIRHGTGRRSSTCCMKARTLGVKSRRSATQR